MELARLCLRQPLLPFTARLVKKEERPAHDSVLRLQIVDFSFLLGLAVLGVIVNVLFLAVADVC